MKMILSKAVQLVVLFPPAALSLPGSHLIPSFTRSRANFDKSLIAKKVHRVLEQEEENETCDTALMDCSLDEDCSSCFQSLDTSNVDWATVDPQTPCRDVLSLLLEGGFCKNVRKGKYAEEVFCKTFDACVWIDDTYYDDDDSEDTDNTDAIDCSQLTSCMWEGMHPSFIGDGKCHDYSCYNTEICGYDGGDCCEDTCLITVPYQYSECGDEGYFCRDPKSASCNNDFTEDCEEKSDEELPEVVKCEKDSSLFRVDMYDSWGDGWDNTVLSIKLDGKEDVYSGSLEKGDYGKESVCLSKGCYHAETGGGIWGNEVAWEIHVGGGVAHGPPIAYGGAPMDCTFSVGTDACENTCTGREIKPFDEQRMGYDKLFNCISSTCVVQLGMCKSDQDCVPCLAEQPPEYCRTNGNYNNLIDCTMCNCVPKQKASSEDEDSDFCATKDRPNSSNKDISVDGNPIEPKKAEKKISNEGECNSDQTLKGSSAVLKYSTCTTIDQTAALLRNWDENNFGPLDEFESCSHTYQNDYAHGGKKALDCMRILETVANVKDDDVREDIWSLANSLYHDAEQFCECSQESNKICPSCASFTHFKTLLHESLDACTALDEIDCAAWGEFYQPCKDNIFDKFGKVDFSNKAQCDYVHSEECGGVGAFPAFRRLDCGSEIGKPAWDFYLLYSRECVGDDSSDSKKDVSPKDSSRASVPSTPKAPETPSKPYTPSSGGAVPISPSSSSEPKPYIPNSSSSSSVTPKPYKKPKKSHRFLKFMFAVAIIAGGAYVYKKRNEDFDFQRYRRLQRFNQPNEHDLYAGLTGRTAPSFEPPTLPPGPPPGPPEPAGPGTNGVV